MTPGRHRAHIDLLRLRKVARLASPFPALALMVLLGVIPSLIAAEPAPPQSAPVGLAGTYAFVGDSDGAKAPESLRITLTFSEGTVLLESTPADPRYRDSGSYEFNAGVLDRFVLPRLGRFVSKGKVTRQANVLTLPFKLLGSGAGTSTWRIPGCQLESIQPVLDDILKKAERRVPPEVRSFLRQSVRPGAYEAADSMRLGTSMNLAGYVPEGIWLLAHAAKLTEDPHVLNNLAHALNQDAEYSAARQLLSAAQCASPGNPFILNNLAYANFQMNRLDEAEMAELKAVSLAPEPEYLWSMCKILHANHKPGDAQRYCDQAMQAGIMKILHPKMGKSGSGGSGSANEGGDRPPGPDEPPEMKPPKGNEDEGMENAPDADPDSTIIGQIGKRDRANDQQPPKPYQFPPNPKPLAEVSKAAGEWVGHWEGQKVTGCIKRTRDFGEGMAKTRVKENICHYAQQLSFDVDASGRIHGEGEALYVFYGKADQYATMMMPLPMPPGGFFATFPGGYRTRKFKVEGVLTPNGTVYIGGRPEKPMYLLNVYMFQKIYGWNVFPPPAGEPAKPGVLSIGKQGDRWTMEATRYNTVSGMKYETLIYKTDQKFEMVKGCKIYCQLEPIKGQKSASLDKIKCEASVGPVTIEGNQEELGVKVNMAGLKLTAGANYGKPGALGKLVKEEATAGCGGFEDESLRSAGTESVGAGAAGMGFSNQRNPITGDETFSFGVDLAPKLPEVDLGRGAKGSNSLGWSAKLVVDSHCGIGAKFSLMQKTSVKEGAEGELGGMKAGASCSSGMTTSMSATAWAGSNIVD